MSCFCTFFCFNFVKKNDMEQIIKFIKENARIHGVNVYDIKLQLSPENFLIVWNHIEGGINEDDMWEVIDSFNLNNKNK